jgi:hypothetical protein
MKGMYALEGEVVKTSPVKAEGREYVFRANKTKVYTGGQNEGV